MEYKRLGNTGMKVSRICLGCMSFGQSAGSWPVWALDEDASRPFIQRALQFGINFFDTADMYSRGRSEEIVGKALKDFSASRDDVVIATKVYFPMSEGPNDKGLSRKHIMSSIDASLKRLGTDYVDLYQIHRWDYETPIEETLASSMVAWQFTKAPYTQKMSGWARFVSMQNLYNLIYREEEREMLPLCEDQKIGVIPWSPLAAGRLARKPNQEGDESQRAQTDVTGKSLFEGKDTSIAERVAEVAEAHGVPMAQVSLAWVLSKSVTAPIIGVTKDYHLDDAVASLNVQLTGDDIKYLEEPYVPQAVVGLD